MASNERPFQKRVEEALAKGLPIPDFPDSSPLRGVVLATHELVMEFMKDDLFTRSEALWLSQSVMNGHPGFPPE